MEKLKWNEVWIQNYSGQSDIAKAISIKANYKGNTYIPWAVMERALYSLDTSGRSEPVINPLTGGFVFTETFELPIVNKDGSEGKALAVSHFVKASCIFLGETFVESFPLQDNSYNAVRLYDQNIVNKALQRAKAKVISRATGIGWGLYESGDLQYELDGAATPTPNQTPIPQAPKKPVEKVEAPKAEKNDTDYATIVHTMFKDAPVEKAQTVIAFVNKSLKRTYNKELSLDQTVEEVGEIISLLAKPDVLVNSIKTQLEVA